MGLFTDLGHAMYLLVFVTNVMICYHVGGSKERMFVGPRLSLHPLLCDGPSRQVLLRLPERITTLPPGGPYSSSLPL